ncbi:YjiH family protein [Staphylococcus chromogenes]|uniref:YjiH family protein n=1 Tax=Staphylococcus chromogenes TaxID=46126 RepID=UPI002883EA31|nr:YjiH family protein [Staphylococcus chromogenes]MDT0693435.1 YjiH family protein [Staphylococcus chromogenes]MDT0700981.1 YjiH family protein [Staphylococcus chromogenes]
MKTYSKKEIVRGRLKFIIMSLIGIFLFLLPISIPNDQGQSETTLPIAWLANVMKDLIGGAMPIIILVIITLSGILTVLCSTIYKDKLDPERQMAKTFSVGPLWIIVRLLAVVFAWLVYFKVGSEVIYSSETGDLVFSSLLPTLVTIFFFAGLFLPFLMSYGLLEFFGPIFRPIMRPLFRLPGRSTVINLASFLGDGTIGVMIASEQYNQGYYTRREATTIATMFSVVSITFVIVIAETIHLSHHFYYFYLTVILACLACAIILPRLWPLNRVPDTFRNNQKHATLQEDNLGNKNPVVYGFEQATIQGIKAPNAKHFFKDGFKTVIDMWLAVLPVVMTIGTLATILATYTPIFRILGLPFLPLFEILQIPAAKEASETVLIGFADMFLPSLLIEGVSSDLTRFVVGALSVSQLIYLSEVGGVILGSKIPVSLPKLFAIFLMRTIIALPIIALMGHLLFTF